MPTKIDLDDSKAANPNYVMSMGDLMFFWSGGQGYAGSIQKLAELIIQATVAEVSQPAISHAIVKFGDSLEDGREPSFGGTFEWKEVVIDTEGFFSAGFPSRFTIPAGVTLVEVGVTIDIPVADTLVTPSLIKITKNGDAEAIVTTQITQAATLVSPPIAVVGGDYIEINPNTTMYMNVPTSRYWIKVLERGA